MRKVTAPLYHCGTFVVKTTQCTDTNEAVSGVNDSIVIILFVIM